MVKKVFKLDKKHPSKWHRPLYSTVTLKCLSLTIGIAVAFMLLAAPAWAVQAHGGTVGLVSHQIGHFLFIIGMGYLLLRLYSIRIKGDGWFHFKSFLWLLLAWNIMTFMGHWMNEFVEKGKFIKADSRTLSFTVENFQDALYYFTRLDHLILVPSFIFLLIALRKWRVPQ